MTNDPLRRDREQLLDLLASWKDTGLVIPSPGTPQHIIDTAVARNYLSDLGGNRYMLTVGGVGALEAAGRYKRGW